MSSNHVTDEQKEIAIHIEGLSKCYQIYDKPHHRLLQGLFGKKRQYYREFWALKDVSMTIYKGETVGIIGQNGSGKSTLLQLLCGTLTPTAGTVAVNGRVAALLELGAGFNPEFTGKENVYMNATILGLSRAEIDARYEQIVAFSEIGEFVNQPVKTYSSGMYVRLAFSVIAHVDADILIVDEALAVGDAFFTQKCMRFLRQFREKGTILFVSHDNAAVVNLCHRAAWLSHGQLQKMGSAKEISTAYMEKLFEARQGQIDLSGHQSAKNDAATHETVLKNLFRQIEPIIDPRWEQINQSAARNVLQLFEFKEEMGAFGTGKAKIMHVSLLNEHGKKLMTLIGGETVQLVVAFTAFEPMFSVIVGFIVKDRLGQNLFGDNSYLTYQNQPLYLQENQTHLVRFIFQMPILPVGDYAVAVAIAEGTQEEHVQHHWMHEALIIRSQTSSVSTGLIGLPMMDVEFLSPECSLEIEPRFVYKAS